MRVATDAALRVVEGTIVDRGSWTELSSRHTDDVLDLREGLVLPGLVDTHVHYPQVRIIGALGLPLLEWLDAVALPEEARLASIDHARAVAKEFVSGLAASGTTTALVFGAHFASAVDVLFEEVRRVGLRVTAGLVVSDRGLPEPLLTTPERAYDEALDLAQRWHHPVSAGRSTRTRYAVTPRFSYGASDELLESCQAVLKDVSGAWFTSHVNESPAEVATVARLFPDAIDYVDTYDRHGLVGPSSVLAHDVHPTERELGILAGRGATVAHCPTSNAALGSGRFPLLDHVRHGVRVSLGSDVGAGTGFSLFKEGLQAYFTQQLLGEAGQPLAPADLLHLATRSGALALGLEREVGDLSVGKAFDALWLRPAATSPLALALRHAGSATEAVARVFALAGAADVAGVWVAGECISREPVGS
ncbi:MAG TPA: guanine deaminase [Humibacillus xanthopallidus]|nr:guanine deaminase [Humibacillus xanthopallidus]